MILKSQLHLSHGMDGTSYLGVVSSIGPNSFHASPKTIGWCVTYLYCRHGRARDVVYSFCFIERQIQQTSRVFTLNLPAPGFCLHVNFFYAFLFIAWLDQSNIVDFFSCFFCDRIVLSLASGSAFTIKKQKKCCNEIAVGFFYSFIALETQHHRICIWYLHVWIGLSGCVCGGSNMQARHTTHK